MASTQYLNVLRVFRGTTLRVRDDVIEMKSGSRFTLHSTTPIALPYFQLNPAWYEPIVFQRSWEFFLSMNFLRNILSPYAKPNPTPRTEPTRPRLLNYRLNCGPTSRLRLRRSRHPFSPWSFRA